MRPRQEELLLNDKRTIYAQKMWVRIVGKSDTQYYVAIIVAFIAGMAVLRAFDLYRLLTN